MRTILMAMLMATAACPAPVGVQSGMLQTDSAGQCAAQCNQIGLVLDAVVVMANNVGCVCRPQAAPPSAGAPTARGASSAGGLTAVLLQIQEQNRRAAQQQQQQQSYQRR